MTTAPSPPRPAPVPTGPLGHRARNHLLRGYGDHTDRPVPVITRGEGPYVWDETGRRYFDAVSACWVVQVGHGRSELVEPAVAQARDLAYFPLIECAHPKAVELAERLAHLAPRDLDRVFFTSGGSETVESAWKLAKQYFKLIGQPQRYKVISRHDAYHGSTHGAMAVSGIPFMDEVFGPLVPGTGTVPAGFSAAAIARAIEAAGPDTVAAVLLEPVSHPGCATPPPGYFREVREVCDRYGVLLIADEVVCGVGRLGHMFGGERYGMEPDIMCLAKGLSSGYAPIGAMIFAERIMEPLRRPGILLLNGYTFSGHPLSAAVTLAHLDLVERERVFDHVRDHESALRATLERLCDLPMVRAVHGAGYLYSIELVKDKSTGEPLTTEECERLLDDYLTKALFAAGLHCRAGDHDLPFIQIAPPLTCEQAHFDEIEQLLRGVLPDLSRMI
ncbi:aminotransferase class III-fold pyridoxal phosphate-dependent enzyme [Actinosynnema sp. NPDC020468]|uniref:aminotransferase class III-fold pyridoxal phosphate-dependent enzyme n=1 Tax=Actinosynnema sp. NPDC020468 TaxID=3154488 RepID=UPI0033D4A009